jgi:hypothetical protein
MATRSWTVKLLTLNKRCLGGNQRFYLLFFILFVCLNCGCRLSKGIKSKKSWKKQNQATAQWRRDWAQWRRSLSLMRSGAGTRRNGARLSDGCAKAQKTSRSGAGAIAGQRPQFTSLRHGAVNVAQWRRHDTSKTQEFIFFFLTTTNPSPPPFIFFHNFQISQPKTSIINLKPHQNSS